MISRIFITFCACLVLASGQDHYDRDFIPFEETFDHNVTAANACTIDIHTQTASPQPVFVRPGQSQFFHPANRNGQMQFTANQAIELWCSGPWASPGEIWCFDFKLCGLWWFVMI
jgi:hypothetical protein